MAKEEFRRDNHFLPSMYLKRWSDDGTRVWIYRLLVSHPNVPEWKHQSSSGIAYHQHLYTRILAGNQTDEFERWLNTEYETPAEEPLYKATSNIRLSAKEWQRLILFATSLNIRTPKSYIEHIQLWGKQMPTFLDEVLRKGVQELKDTKQRGQLLEETTSQIIDPIPLAFSTHFQPKSDKGILKAVVLVGRQSWLSSIRYVLTNTALVLTQHKWVVLTACEKVDWFTSDDPFIRLNYYKNGQYDFRGGWGSKGTELLLPLSPHHLLYTQIGRRPSLEKELSYEKTLLLRRLIAEHAHRLIISTHKDSGIIEMRPRYVNSLAFEQERDEWIKWDKQQTEAEKNLCH